jgi:hypothetical protein
MAKLTKRVVDAAESREEDHVTLAGVEQEPGTGPWFGLRFSDTAFGTFEGFPDKAARDAHELAPQDATSFDPRNPRRCLRILLISTASVNVRRVHHHVRQDNHISLTSADQPKPVLIEDRSLGHANRRT